jgi:hypothetical protein
MAMCLNWLSYCKHFFVCFQNLAKSGQELILEHAFARDCLGTLYSMYSTAPVYMYAYGICDLCNAANSIGRLFRSRPLMHEKSAEMYSTFPLRLSESDYRVSGGFLLVILVSHGSISLRKRMTEKNF